MKYWVELQKLKDYTLFITYNLFNLKSHQPHKYKNIHHDIFR